MQLKAAGPGQLALFYREHRNLAEANELFMTLVREGLTRDELARNIERNPQLWSRFNGFLKTLPNNTEVKNSMTFVATTYEKKPAVLDTVTRVYYFGFQTMEDARQRADELNAWG